MERVRSFIQDFIERKRIGVILRNLINCLVQLNLMPYMTQVAVGNLKELCVFVNDYPTVDGTGGS